VITFLKQNAHQIFSLPAGLKVNNQLVAYATRFSAVRLKNHVWSHHRALKAKVQCEFSGAYSPDHYNVVRLIYIINIRYNITRQKIRKSHHFSSIGVCSTRLISHSILRT